MYLYGTSSFSLSLFLDPGGRELDWLGGWLEAPILGLVARPPTRAAWDRSICRSVKKPHRATAGSDPRGTPIRGSGKSVSRSIYERGGVHLRPCMACQMPPGC